MAIPPVGSTSVSLPKTTATSSTSTTKKQPTGYEQNQSVFEDPTTTEMIAQCNKDIQGKENPQWLRWETVMGQARISALTNPEKARELLTVGIRDKDGRVIRAPEPPTTDLGKMLTKVANGEPITRDELTGEMTKVRGQAFVDKMFMDRAMADFEKMTEEANKKREEALKKGDPGAV